ncbi:MAG: hypothetical protein SFV15_05930 [Polyangiaceae bacterium]|nr:hypothetical protein [Polyangiaceae bacterium]
MGQLLSCPFCRELYGAEEASRCPTCDVELVPLGSLPLSDEARLEDALSGTVEHPDDVRFGLFYFGKGRGLLVLLALAGLGCFFAPWLSVTAPDPSEITGFQIAHRRSGWFWGGALGFFILIPLLVTRRCAYDLRGVRVISATFAVLTLLEVLILFWRPPTAGRFIRITYDWGWGLYASAIISAAATWVALRLGGPRPEPAPKVAPEPTRAPAIDRNKNLKLH